MRIAVAREIDPAEGRVAATPETVKKMKGLGADVAVEPGAGTKSGIPDAEFTAAGATVTNGALKDADVVLKVRRPAASELAGYKRGALVIAIMDPYGEDAALKAMADAGITAFAMELLPRITRAQVMDVLSSQANLAGYRAVIDAAAEYGRALPMMMTAAGTIPAAKAIPTAPPSNAKRQLSTKPCRRNLPGEAPSAARTAISRFLPQPRAINRLVKLAQAISRTNVAAARRTR